MALDPRRNTAQRQAKGRREQMLERGGSNLTAPWGGHKGAQ